MNENEIRDLLKTRMDEALATLYRTKYEFAHYELGCSTSFLYDVLAGRRRPGDKVRDYLGITKSVVYSKQEQ